MTQDSIKLSVLILSVPTRTRNFLPNIIDKVTKQAKDKPVEILCLLDNFKSKIGTKRNNLVNISQWEYIVFIDDDDDIDNEYIDLILKGIEYNTDVITFDWKISINWSEYETVNYKLWNKDDKVNWVYTRRPNHLMCYKKEIIQETPYRNLNWEEDAYFAKDIAPKLNTEHHIDKILYIYNYNAQTSEAGINS